MKSYQQIISDAINHVAKGGKIMLRPRCNGKKMSDHYFLNDDHTYKPCDLMTWANQFETLDRHVGENVVNNNRISTVWLGLCHRYGDGPPIVFETMVFHPEGHDTYCERYTTWQQAEEGHKRAIQWVKDGCKEDER